MKKLSMLAIATIVAFMVSPASARYSCHTLVYFACSQPPPYGTYGQAGGDSEGKTETKAGNKATKDAKKHYRQAVKQWGYKLKKCGITGQDNPTCQDIP